MVKVLSTAISLEGHDAPFVNNYGVWKDEFDALNLTHTLEHIWKNTDCHFAVDK